MRCKQDLAVQSGTKIRQLEWIDEHEFLPFQAGP